MRKQREKKRMKYPSNDLATKQAALIDQHGDDEGRRAFLRWRCLNDTFYFGSTFLRLGEHCDKNTGRSRVDPVFHGWLCSELDRREPALVLLPRDHCKTTWVCINVAQEILRDPGSVRTAMFSLAEGLASKNLIYVRSILMMPQVRRLFSDIVPDPGKSWRGWTTCNANQLTMMRPEGAAPLKEEQLEAWGMGKRITGHHFMHIILDDVIDQTNVTTPEQIQKVAEWVGYLVDILDPEGYITIVGTRYHFDDIYARVMRSKVVAHRHITRRATEVRPEVEATRKEPLPKDVMPGDLEDPLSETIYEFYDKNMLREKQAEKLVMTGSDEQFFAQYYNNPISQSTAIFPKPLATYDELRHSDRARVFIAVDQAFTSHSASDDTAIAVGYFDDHDYLWIEECKGLRADWAVVGKELTRLIAIHKPIRVGVENLLFWQFRYIFTSEAKEWQRVNGQIKDWPIVSPIKIPKGGDKTARINITLGAFVRAGRVFVKNTLTTLKQQMEEFPRSRRDDLVDASAMLIALSGMTSNDQKSNKETEEKGWTFARLTNMIQDRIGHYKYGENFRKNKK